MSAYKQHPLSAAFPAMPAAEYEALRESIEAIGVQNPATLYEGMIIDGWHRYCASRDVGFECPLQEMADVDPVQFVKAQNKTRRNLAAGQWAVIEVSLNGWRSAGRPNNSAPGAELSAKQMAKNAGVGVRTIEQAKVAVAAGLTDAVRDGKVSAKRAAEIAKLPEPERAAAIDAPKPPKPEKVEQPAADPAPTEPAAKSFDWADMTPPPDDEDNDNDNGEPEPMSEVEQLESALAEANFLLSRAEEENELLRRVVNADDRIKSALTEVKNVRDLLYTANERVKGLTFKEGVMAGEIKTLRRKVAKLEKAAVPA